MRDPLSWDEPRPEAFEPAGLSHIETERLVRAVDELLLRHLGDRRGGSAAGLDVLDGAEAVAQRERGLVEGVSRELLCITAEPPTAPDAVVVRTLWDAASLDAPDAFARASARAAAGERIRAVRGVPAEVLIADRRAALVRIRQPVQGGPEIGVSAEEPHVVGLLGRLFELAWAQADRLFEPTGLSELPEELEGVVRCLSAGMTDQAIQRALGISRRTLTRRIQRLHEWLGVRSRFQAGLRIAAFRGDPQHPSDP